MERSLESRRGAGEIKINSCESRRRAWEKERSRGGSGEEVEERGQKKRSWGSRKRTGEKGDVSGEILYE